MNIWSVLALIALCFVVAAAADRKGKSKVVWFVMSLVISPFLAAIALFFVKPAGHETTRSNKDLLAAGVALIVVLGFTLAQRGIDASSPPSGHAVANTSDSDAGAPAPADDDASRFTVSDFSLHRNEYDGVSVRGVVQNNTDKQFSYVQIELNVYDKDGAQLGSDMVNVNNLEPHARWKFDTPILQTGVDSVKIKNITAF